MFDPASATAIEAATNALLQSIHSGEELTFDWSSTHAERTSFLQVDSYVNALDKTIEAISNALKLHRYHFATRRNSLVPLGRLPVEILSAIFLFVLSDNYDDLRLRFKHLFRLRGVSKTFRSIINHTPSLWTSIPSNCPLPVVSEALLRSKTFPILVYGQEEMDDTGEIVLPTNRGFLEAVVDHVDRWEGLHLTFSSTVALQNALIKPAPRLKELSLVVSVGENEAEAAGTHVEIFGGQVGQLGRLHLSSVPVRWDSVIFKGLEWLAVDNSSGHLDPSSKEILQALSYSPNLRVLDLVNLRSDSIPASSGWSLVRLNDLEEITLFYVHSSIIDIILSYIIAPSCRIIRVTAEMSATRAKYFVQRELLPKFPALLSAVSLSQKSELILGDAQSAMVVWRSSVLQSSGKQAEIALEIGDGGETDYSSTVEALFPDDLGHIPAKLRLHKRFLCESQWDAGDIQRVLVSRRHFTEVEIDLPGERDMDIFYFLDSDLYANLNHTILPSMSSLVIRGSAWRSEPLANALHSRFWSPLGEVTRLRLIVHESVNWDDGDLDVLRSRQAVESVDWMGDVSE
ncbi:hypothetical protein FS837_006445 [Tulasnella sp. UAMH 9824]|nr:hypothetical protein FS837_006445 [Tulasnella sp. UAMH 9824]